MKNSSVIASALLLAVIAAYPAKSADKPKSEASLECSKQADAKGLHGKERKKFRSECKKEAAEKPKS